MSTFLVSFGIIAFGLSLGYGIQVASHKGFLRVRMGLDRVRKGLQRIALLGINPVTVVGALWLLDMETVSVAALPFLGCSALLLGGALALGASRLMGLEPRKAGAFLVCGSFTNIGSIGALICFLFLGERGFALVPIYKLFEEVTYYCVGFPVAKYYSRSRGPEENAWQRLKGLARDPFILVALSAILAGGLLSASGVERPAFFKTMNSLLIPLATTLLLVSIGLAMKFRRVGIYLRECLAVSAIKFLLVPFVISLAAYGLGFGRTDDGLTLKVVIILSSMPVAFNALIPPSIYDLDLDLANSCWFFTTSALVAVLPLLLMVLKAI